MSGLFWFVAGFVSCLAISFLSVALICLEDAAGI